MVTCYVCACDADVSQYASHVHMTVTCICYVNIMYKLYYGHMLMLGWCRGATICITCPHDSPCIAFCQYYLHILWSHVIYVHVMQMCHNMHHMFTWLSHVFVLCTNYGHMLTLGWCRGATICITCHMTVTCSCYVNIMYIHIILWLHAMHVKYGGVTICITCYIGAHDTDVSQYASHVHINCYVNII